MRLTEVFSRMALLALLAAVPGTAALAEETRATVRQFDPATGSWVRKERSLTFKSPWSDSAIRPQVVPFAEKLPAGTIVVDTAQRRLFHLRGDGTAMRYGIGVGREGFDWRGRERISRKAEWPDWRPPADMVRREAAEGRILPAVMEGGPENPLGARALYLGSTLFRIHGTNQPWTIGKAVSSGCIRMMNDDVIALYNQVKIGTLVVVR
ncbi:L,D-transpeptidase [Nitratireductor pacificus]|uniref:ErfK/YbiS/YcfS/YnhG family protein n=1 Tax=Nitratireductor pacificus pht-3B TaxID=391937 RepID=K2M5C6_9HYPH|nr:L,D-transpeptidase [Nitratireductor pacificus]EKF17346.1 ErfK/YbiS/YcfS/YnhG family protein [Nitratireductor pacificus pht-3B]